MAFFSKRNTEQPGRRQRDETSRQANTASLDERYLFRRNRTITGSSSSQVSSVSEHVADMQSPRVQAHHLVKKRRHVGLLFVGVLAISGLLFLLINQFTATVSLTSDTPLPIDASRYESRIQTYLNERPVERLRFLRNTEQLTRYIQAEAPEVAEIHEAGSVDIGKANLHFTLRHPAVSWELPDTGRQYVDTTGVTFTRNYYPTPEVEVIDQSGVRIETGQTVASSRFLGFVGRLVGAMRSYNTTVTQIIIPPATTRQVEMRLKDITYPVKVSIDRPVGEQAEDTVKAVQWLQGQGRQAQYLDVRISGKAYYK